MNEDRQISDFDRLMGSLHGLPDVVSTKPTTINVFASILGVAQMYTVQTFRQRSGEGKDATTKDTLFVQLASHEGLIRVAFPAEVCDAIARQRESVGSKTRKKAAKRVAAERKEAGIVPAFMRKRKAAK